MKILLIGLLILALTSSLKHTHYKDCVWQGDIKYHHDFGVCGTNNEILTCYNKLEELIPNPEEQSHILDLGPLKSTEYHQDEITFTVETRYHTSTDWTKGKGIDFAAGLENRFNQSQPGAEGSGYCKVSNPSHPINNANMCNGEQFDTIWKFELIWDDEDSNFYGFRFGMDFIRGFAVQMDGIWVISEPDNILWQDDFENLTAQMFQKQLAPGRHTLIIYGQEPFTDELGKGYDIEFHVGEKEAWETLSIENLSNNLRVYSKIDLGQPLRPVETMYYQAVLSYVNGFQFDNNCLTQKITVGDKVIPRGGHYINQWAYSSFNNKTAFVLKHDDLVDYYGCKIMDHHDETIIECEIKIEYFMGISQQVQKGFHLNVIVSKEEGEAPILSILPKPIIENQYDYTLSNNIEFCADLQCTKLLDRNNDKVSMTERHQDLFIRHELTSENADKYTLFYYEVLVNGFSPNKKIENRKEGYSVYQITNNFAGDNLEVEVISRLKFNGQGSSNNQELIRAHRNIQIIDPVAMKEEEEKEQEYIESTEIYHLYQQCDEDSKQVPLAIALTATFSLLVGVILGGLALFIYHYKQKSKKLEQPKPKSQIDQVIDTNFNTEHQQLPSQASSRTNSRRPSETLILQE